MYTHSRTILIPILASLLFFYGLFCDIHALRLVSKPIPVLYLIWMHIHQKNTQTALLYALGFSVIGDIILELPQHLPFALGLASFLIAHLFFIRCFLQKNTQPLYWSLVPILLYCSSLFFYMLPKLGPLTIPVAIYVLVISAMLWSASRYAYTNRYYLPLFGATIFAVSDSLIAINKFISPFDGARYAIIITYWIAQYLIYTIVRKIP